MVVVEDFLGLGEVDRELGALAPGQRDDPVEIGPGHGVLGGRRRHAREALQLAQGLLLRVLRHAGGFDLVAQLGDLALLVVAVAQLLLDRLHLLAQVVLALVLLQLAFLTWLWILLPTSSTSRSFTRTLLMRSRRARTSSVSRNSCFWRRIQRRQVRRDEVREAGRLLDVGGERRQLVRQGGRELDHPLEEAQDALRQRADLDLLLRARRPRGRSSTRARRKGRYWVTCRIRKRCDALHDEPQRSVRETEHLVDVGERADREEVALHGVVDAGVSLRDDADHLAFLDGVVHQGHGALPHATARQDGLRGTAECPAGAQSETESVVRSRSTSYTPSDSKSGLRSSLIRLLCSSVAASGAQRHVHQLALQALEGLGLARGTHRALVSSWHSRQSAAKGRRPQTRGRISTSHSWQRP